MIDEQYASRMLEETADPITPEPCDSTEELPLETHVEGDASDTSQVIGEDGPNPTTPEPPKSTEKSPQGTHVKSNPSDVSKVKKSNTEVCI